MATATKKKKAGGTQLDQKAKIKVIAASVLLVLAIGWILIWSFGSGGSGAPALSAEELAQEEQIQQEEQQEIKKVKEEFEQQYRGRTMPAPTGS